MFAYLACLQHGHGLREVPGPDPLEEVDAEEVGGGAQAQAVQAAQQGQTGLVVV